MLRSLIILLALATIAIYSSLTDRYFSDSKQSAKLSKFDLALYRADIEFLKTRDPKTNKLPIGIKDQELNFIKNIPSASGYYRFDKHGYPIVQSQKWSSFGPNNIAGRIKDIEFDKSNDKRIICGSASGGVWVSDDLGSNWRKTNSAGFEQTAYCIEQDKRDGNTDVWYYGTGELLSTTNRQYLIATRTVGLGNGIYKSTDNGNSWLQLESTKVLDNASLNDVFQGIWDIKVDNNKTENDVVFAACAGGIMKSENGGIDWSTSLVDMNNKSFSSDIDISSNGIYYAAISAMSINSGHSLKRGVYRSTDGITWKDITPQGFPEDTRVVKIQSAPSNGNILYVLTESPRISPDPFFDFASSHHTFWKYTYNPSENKGYWEERTENLPHQDIDFNQSLFNSLGGYCLTFSVKPDNEDVVFLGGTNLFRSNVGFASNNFLKIGGYSTGLHPDQHCITFLPDNSKILYSGSDGGVNITNDCMSNNNNLIWIDKNIGLVTAQFYSVALDHKSYNDNVLVGGLQDQGTIMKKNDLQNNWRQIYGGDGLSCFVANNKSFVVVSVYNGILYGGMLNGDYFSVPQSNLLLSDELYDANINFFTIFDVEPNNNEELYLAVNNSIYRKNFLKQSIINPQNRNSDWQKISSSILPTGVNVSAIEMSKNPADRLYFGTDNGKVYRIDDANLNNPSRIDISGDEFPQNAYVSCIVVDPLNADNIFVTFSNYNVQSIFYSSDGGASWTIQGGNLEENPDGSGAGPSIRCIEILHMGGETIYFVGTSSGLFSTKSLAGVNTIWVNESPDLIGNIKIDMITARQLDGFVAVATQGNGVYTNSFVVDVKDNNSEISDISVSVFPNPSTSELNFLLNLSENAYYELKIYDLKGNLIDIPIRKLFNSGKHSLNYNLEKLKSGSYFYIFHNIRKSYKGKFLVNK